MRDHVRNLLAASAYSDTLTVMRQLAYHALNLGVGGWSTKRILVVDDSRVVRKYVARLLEREGYTIDFAANGHEALAQMKKRFYDCVFMDLEMPVMNGQDCTKALRNWEAAIDRSRRQMICAVSSPSAEKEEEAISSGIDVYQSKPAPASELVKTILTFRQQDQPQPE